MKARLLVVTEEDRYDYTQSVRGHIEDTEKLKRLYREVDTMSRTTLYGSGINPTPVRRFSQPISDPSIWSGTEVTIPTGTWIVSSTTTATPLMPTAEPGFWGTSWIDEITNIEPVSERPQTITQMDRERESYEQHRQRRQREADERSRQRARTNRWDDDIPF